MRTSAVLFPMLVLAAPLIAVAADPADDGIVILSVTPRDPAVKGEILLTPVKRSAVAARGQDAARRAEVQNAQTTWPKANMPSSPQGE
jgi:hypothetical protein